MSSPLKARGLHSTALCCFDLYAREALAIVLPLRNSPPLDSRFLSKDCQVANDLLEPTEQTFRVW
jgi:hypothetical protein